MKSRVPAGLIALLSAGVAASHLAPTQPKIGAPVPGHSPGKTFRGGSSGGGNGASHRALRRPKYRVSSKASHHFKRWQKRERNRRHRAVAAKAALAHCRHLETATFYDYIPGEAVMEPQYDYCVKCGVHI